MTRTESLDSIQIERVENPFMRISAFRVNQVKSMETKLNQRGLSRRDLNRDKIVLKSLLTCLTREPYEEIIVLLEEYRLLFRTCQHTYPALKFFFEDLEAIVTLNPDALEEFLTKPGALK